MRPAFLAASVFSACLRRALIAGTFLQLVRPQLALAQEAASDVRVTGENVQETQKPEQPQDEESQAKQKRKKPKVKVSGVLSVIYKLRIEESGDGQVEPSNFRLGKARISVGGQLNQWLGYTIDVDPRSPSILGVVRDAYLSFTVIPYHELRLGQQKTQFGWENRQSSTRLYTITRSELSESLGRGVTLRDLGIGVIGKLPIDGQFRLEDAVTLVNGNGFGTQADDTSMKNLWGRLGVRYANKASDLTLRLGVSGAIGDQLSEAEPGPPPVPSERFQFRRFGADFELDQRWVFFVAEVALGRDEIPANSGQVESSSAWYVELVGKSPWEVGPVLRYDAWDAEEFKRFTAGAYWGAPDAPFRVLVHYEYFEDEAGLHDGRVLSLAQVRF